jgi:hypothetical protein
MFRKLRFIEKKELLPMQAEIKNLEIVQEEPQEEVLSEEEVLNYLTAVGVNASHRQYDEVAKKMYQAYLELPLPTLADAWEHLNDQVKIAILNAHLEDFKKWVKGSSDV